METKLKKSCSLCRTLVYKSWLRPVEGYEGSLYCGECVDYLEKEIADAKAKQKLIHDECAKKLKE